MPAQEISPKTLARGTTAPFRAHFSRAMRAFLCASAMGLAVLAVLAPANPAFGQTSKTIEPPRPNMEDNDWPIAWNYMVMILIIGLVVGANCIPSKRGHQD